MTQKQASVRFYELEVRAWDARVKDAENAWRFGGDRIAADRAKLEAEAAKELSALRRELELAKVNLDQAKVNLQKASADLEAGFEQ